MHNARAKQTAEFFRTATANDICEFVNNLTGECWKYDGCFLTDDGKDGKRYAGDEGGEIEIISVVPRNNPISRTVFIHIESAGFAMDFDLENNYLES